MYDSYRLDKASIKRSFSRAAQAYDAAAILQREICERTLAHLDPIRLTPGVILDLGTGTGYAIRRLHARFKSATVYGVDLAFAMVRQARSNTRSVWRRNHYVCSDAEALPFNAASFDLVFSCLMLQWCANLDRVFAECRRVLKPGGLLLFATFGPDTLRELRESWRHIDDSTRVHLFMDMHDVGDALIRTGFGSPVLDVETVTMQYPSAFELLRDLKRIGATNATSERSRGLLSYRRLQRLANVYEERYRIDGRLPASYEVVYGHGWALEPSERRQDGTTVTTFPFTALKVK